jgi:hypothetical protein
MYLVREKICGTNLKFHVPYLDYNVRSFFI